MRTALAARGRLGLLATVSLAALAAAGCQSAPEKPPEASPPRPRHRAALTALAQAVDEADLGHCDPRDPRTPERVAALFARAGLAPRQGAFVERVQVSARERPAPDSALVIDGRPFALGSEMTVAPGSVARSVEGELVFAGFGLNDEALGHDDLAGIELGGKIALVFAGLPDEGLEESPWRHPARAALGQVSTKARLAKEHGARALVVVAAPGTYEAHAGRLPAAARAPASEALPLPVLFAETAATERALAGAGVSLSRLAEVLQKERRPASMPLDVDARLHAALVPDAQQVWQVVGRTSGEAPDVVVLASCGDDEGLMRAPPRPRALPRLATLLYAADVARALPSSPSVWLVVSQTSGARAKDALLGLAPKALLDVSAVAALDQPVFLVGPKELDREPRADRARLISRAGLKDAAALLDDGALGYSLLTAGGPAPDERDALGALLEAALLDLAAGGAAQRKPAPERLGLVGTPSLAPFPGGVPLLLVERGSEADRLGLRPGDVVIAVDGAQVTTAEALYAALAKRRGGSARLAVRRGALAFDLDAEVR